MFWYIILYYKSLKGRFWLFLKGKEVARNDKNVYIYTIFIKFLQITLDKSGFSCYNKYEKS